MDREVGSKKLNIVLYEVNSTLADMAVYLAQKASDALTKSCSLQLQQVVLQPYMWLNFAVIPFQVLSHRSHCLLSLKQKHTLSEVGTPLKKAEGAGATARSQSV